MQFRAICSKWNQKLTLSLSASSIDEARTMLHGQGYSIMEIQEEWVSIKKDESNDNFFYFDAIINGQVKSGKIQSVDVFKAYTKLVDDLGYNILYIYTTEGMNETQKKVITAKVKDGYVMYKQSMGFDMSEKKEQTEREISMAEISPTVLKELAHYNAIIDSTVEKIQNLFLKYHKTITPEKKKELENIESNLAQTKGLSNLWRMKMIVEWALTTIGKLESELVKWGLDTDKQKLMDETNALLKQIWSSERIESNETKPWDIGKSISNFFESFQKKDVSKSEQKKKVDTNSFIFYKNLRELNIYKQNLNKVVIDIIKAIFTFQFSQVKRLRLKKKLLEQDIQIIDNRIHNKNISYTKIVKWSQYYVNIFLEFFQRIGDIFLYGMVIYTVFYMFLRAWEHLGYITFSTDLWFFLFLAIFASIAFLFSFFRSILSLFIGWGFFLFLFIFLTINF